MGCRISRLKQSLFLASLLPSLGFSYLLTRWLPKLKRWALTSPSTFITATHVFVSNSFGQTELVPVLRRSASSSSHISKRFLQKCASGYQITALNYRCNSYLLDYEAGCFVSVDDIVQSCLPDVNDNMNGLSSERHCEVQSLLGKNLIELKERSGLQIFFSEMLNPFYIFQVASFFIWIFENYYLYSFVILLMATISALLTVVETKHNLDKMQNMARFTCPVKCYRDQKIVSISSEDLVPGDLIILDEDIDIVPCDGVLVNGDAIVDESMLTGESIPVSKIDITDDAYSIIYNEAGNENPKHCVYSGTKLLQSRSRHGRPPMLMATRTGFLTAKGTLVQSILFPRPNNFRFYRDSLRFVAILGVIAGLGFSVALINFLLLGVSLYLILSRALDVITVVVPPALPATMAVGTVFAIKRLEKKGIYCISPPRINVSSKVEIMCFDKTGTLTEEGLEIFGVISTSPSGFNAVSHDPSGLCGDAANLLQLMASCHSIRRINGRLLGDSLDLKMFGFTGWSLEELQEVGEAIVPTIVRPPGAEPFDATNFCQGSSRNVITELGIIRQFDFDSELRRMSVLVRSLSNDSIQVYVKGSPESLVEVCRDDTIPENYNELLVYYAHRGFRVIGCAMKTCASLSWVKAQKMTRDQAESDLIFLGFIVFENRIKSETTPTILSLKSASIKSVMATGDNILTAISVGRASAIIEEPSLVFYPSSYRGARTSREISWVCVDDVDLKFDPVRLCPSVDKRSYTVAISGDFFEWILSCFPEEYWQKVISNCVIYSRMSPQQKQLLVEILQRNSLVVGFCGDGANDCGALKAANVGISLSQAEASIAAPFTSKLQNISCVPELFKEGRASLVTSFCCFKYMTLYSMIQFTTLIFLYSFGYTLSDGQFVYIDLVLIVPLGILMSRYAPAKKLTAQQPTAKLISVEILVTIFGHIFLQTLAQAIVYWFIAAPLRIGWIPPPDDEEGVFHPSASVMFLFSSFLYITTALLFSTGHPFRQKFYWPFSLYSFMAFISVVIVVFGRIRWLDEWLELTALSMTTRYLVLISAIIHTIISFAFDYLISPVLTRFISRRFS